MMHTILCLFPGLYWGYPASEILRGSLLTFRSLVPSLTVLFHHLVAYVPPFSPVGLHVRTDKFC